MQLRANGAYSFTANLYTPTAPECIFFHHFLFFFEGNKIMPHCATTERSDCLQPQPRSFAVTLCCAVKKGKQSVIDGSLFSS